MDLIVLDPIEQAELIDHRRRSRSDHHDEVWNGNYVLTPLPDNEHQEILWNLTLCLVKLVESEKLGVARPGANVTDQLENWEHNYRCSDVVVYRSDTSAQRRSDHCFGGPDFVVEVITRFDRTRKKIDFYAEVGVRELLIVDRYPWSLELYRLSATGNLDLVARSTVEHPNHLVSLVLPLTFRLVAGDDRPQIALTHHDGVQTWSI